MTHQFCVLSHLWKWVATSCVQSKETEWQKSQYFFWGNSSMRHCGMQPMTMERSSRAQELCETELRGYVRQSSGGVWKSRWTSWAPVPNKPTVSVDVKQHFNNNNNNNNNPRGLSDLQESDNRRLTCWHSSEEEVRSTVVWRPSTMQRHTSKLPKLMSEQTTSKKKSDEKDVPVVQFMYLVFTRMPGESYRRPLRSWLCLRDVFRALINSLVCWKSMSLTCPSWLRLTIRRSRVCRLQFWLGQQAHSHGLNTV